MQTLVNVLFVLLIFSLDFFRSLRLAKFYISAHLL